MQDWPIKTCFGVATITSLILVSIDQMVFPFTYASAFVTPTSWLHLITLAIAVAFFCAPILAVGIFAFSRLSAALQSRFGDSAIPFWGFVAIVSFVLLLITNQSSGKIFSIAPWWHLVGVIVVIATYTCVAYAVHTKLPRSGLPVYLFSFFVGAAFLANYLPLFLKGGFGFTGHKQTIMRSAMTAAIFLATAAIPIVYSVWEKLWEKVPRFISVGLVAAGLIVLHIVNITLYVDNYPEIHQWLAWVSIAVCANTVSRIIPTTPSKTIPLCGVAAVIAGLFIATTSLGSTAGYVGAVHTGWVRYGLTTFHHDLGNAPRNVRNMVVRTKFRIDKRRGIEKQVVTSGKLPAGFEPITQTEGEKASGVVLIFLDMKKPEWFGAYGGSLTPKIDACFRDGFVFENAFTIAPKTNIAFPALYTSTYPATRHDNQNTIVKDPFWFSQPENVNLGSIFKNAGFATSVITNAWYHRQFFEKKSEAVFFSGFDRVIGESAEGANHTQKFVNAFNDSLDVIPETGNYLSVFHLFEHWPESMPAVDQAVETICDEIKSKGRWQDTVIILTADHGVQEREHGRTHYGMTLFDEEVRVPLLVHAPATNLRSNRLQHNVTLLDILPTALQQTGVATKTKFEGRDLFDREDRDVFLETRLLSSPSSAVVSGSKKLIRWRKTGHEALFDRKTDPGEIHNVIATDTDADEMRKRLDTFLKNRGEQVWP